ncbi:hypothetical protein, partial [Rhizobium laguerreae]|uniref:hypothetical protein n=1 Tax=Rhizobium laguerreae TaxID=1076926 RepID=UPI001C921241
DVMRCCAAEMAPHRNPPLPNQQQQPKTAGANSKLDKTWGQGQIITKNGPFTRRRLITSEQAIQQPARRRENFGLCKWKQ